MEDNDYKRCVKCKSLKKNELFVGVNNKITKTCSICRERLKSKEFVEKKKVWRDNNKDKMHDYAMKSKEKIKNELGEEEYKKVIKERNKKCYEKKKEDNNSEEVVSD